MVVGIVVDGVVGVCVECCVTVVGVVIVIDVRITPTHIAAPSAKKHRQHH